MVLAQGDESSGHDPRRRLVVEFGSIADYRALARFHYRAGAPATHVRVLRAMDRVEGSVIGVLVVSMPVLVASWRERAWPGRFSGIGRRELASRINREIRTISRVVVDPRWRGLGVATWLVRAYLQSPLTVSTEAVAAMGSWCGFFSRAGMRGYVVGPSRGDAALVEVLARNGYEPYVLLDASVARRAWVARALRRWAMARPATRGLRGVRLREAAVASLLARPIAFAFDKGGLHGREDGGASGDTRCVAWVDSGSH